MAERELEWNLGVSRIKFIGQLVNMTRAMSAQAKLQRTKGNIKKYFTLVQLLYDELRPYMRLEGKDDLNIDIDLGDRDTVDGINDVDELLNSIENVLQGNQRSAQNVLPTICTLERGLQEKRIELGLDIPQKTKLDPDRAATQGRDI